ncbi:protein disulfide oxidoreductase [Moritella sp. 28]|uniref:protein disulfide oxidoreductase n=1 Tax=Moritella sp. 28 TaxID=2746232 RepID=UPI001BAB26BA|nr:protein disulfide oxidoreductase [Moritella sp. 28]QUM85810.1 protein disulfide oxidoreductase [Moritella sp. 28]
MKQRLLGWTKQLVIFLLLALVITTAVDVWRGKEFPKHNIPALAGMTLAGEQVDLAELSKDQAVVVYFWATWCPVCRFVSPAVETLSEYYPVVTVALSSGEEIRVKKYLQHHEYDFDVVNDENYDLGRDWNVKVTPTILIVKDGEVKWFTTGFTSLPGIWWRLMLS